MKRNKLKTATANRSTISAIGIGVAISAILTGALSALLTSLVINGTTSENNAGIFVFMIRAISVLLGCLAGSSLVEGKMLITIGCTALGYLILLLAIGIIAYDGSFENFIGGAGSVLSGGLASCIIKLGGQRKTKPIARYKV